jgi:hypothetical protein
VSFPSATASETSHFHQTSYGDHHNLSRLAAIEIFLRREVIAIALPAKAMPRLL